MKTEKNILIVFLLNLFFAIFEFAGGIYTGSVSILSDAVHDFGDAAGVGISFLFEKMSKKQPDRIYTYGYARYSLLGGLCTTLILLIGSVAVTYNAVFRMMHPTEIKGEMVLFAFVGMFTNLCAAFFVRHGDSMNQKAVRLHMLEDVLGWVVVLIGAIIIRFTNFVILDPIMSLAVAVFIFVNAVKNFWEIIEIFLEKTPHNIDVDEIADSIKNIEGVTDVHHIHIWSLDGYNSYATMHVVTKIDSYKVKRMIREKLHEHRIDHVTLEIESEGEHCSNVICRPMSDVHQHHSCHHSH